MLRKRPLPLIALLLTACNGNITPAPVPSATAGTTVAAVPSPSAPLARDLTVEQRPEASLPQPREELAVAALGTTLYAIGGYDAAGHDTNTVFVHTSDGWSNGPPVPVRLDHPSAAVLADRLYVAGGFSAAGASRAVYRLAGDRWEAVAPMRHARGG